MMETTVQCFLPYVDEAQIKATVASLRESALIGKITLLSTDASAKACLGCNIIYIDNINSSATMKKIADAAEADYTLLYTKYNHLVPGYFAIDRFVKIARDTQAGMLYADHYSVSEGKRTASPVIDYQKGSLRDNFKDRKSVV